MNEQLINNQYVAIRILIGQKRLKEALVQLESYLWQISNWELHNRLEQAQTSYKYMLQYMQQGVADPERRKLHLKLLANVWEITDQARLILLDSTSERYYHICRRTQMPPKKLFKLSALLSNLESFHDDLAVSELLSEANAEKVIQRHEDIQTALYIQTWTNSAWTPEEEATAHDILLSRLLPINDLCMFTGAVMLSAMECFDLRKLMWLMDAYQHPDVQISQRALVGMVFVFHVCSCRLDFYPEVKNRIELLNEELPLKEDLTRVYKQLLLCRETEKIDKKMRDEIIPEMLKNIPSMRHLKFGFEESDEEKDDQNPDWEHVFEKSGLNDRLREMNELQMEGADVYMSTFSTLKSSPFFRELNNWFYPFDKQHSTVRSILKDTVQKTSMLDLILQSGFFCNSDKYSLFFTLQQVPQSQRDMMLSQLTEQQVEELADQSKADTLKKFSERPATVSSQYLHDLYRFFKLYTRRHEFLDIFKEEIALHRIPILKSILLQTDILSTLAEFHRQKEHWAEASTLYKEIEELNEDTGSQAEFYQKLGYALQKQKKYRKAIEAYLKADTIKPDTTWTNQHLALCYRMNREHGKALEYYRKIERVTPENHSVLFYAGSCLAELHQYEEAMKYFFKLDFLENNSVKAWRGIGWCSFVTGKHEQAIKYYHKVIERNPLPVDYLNTGHAAWAMGNIEKAIASYTQTMAASENKELFLDLFYKDKNYLVGQGVAEEDIPLMMDLL